MCITFGYFFFMCSGEIPVLGLIHYLYAMFGQSAIFRISICLVSLSEFQYVEIQENIFF